MNLPYLGIRGRKNEPSCDKSSIDAFCDKGVILHSGVDFSGIPSGKNELSCDELVWQAGKMNQVAAPGGSILTANIK